METSADNFLVEAWNSFFIFLSIFEYEFYYNWLGGRVLKSKQNFSKSDFALLI